MDLQVKQVSRETKYTGRILTLAKDVAELPDGRTCIREVILTNDGVGILAITPKDEVILVKQWRYPLEKAIFEIPAGKMDDGETDPLETAKRELREETGYTATGFKRLSPIVGMPGICGETVHIYMAQDLNMDNVGTAFDEDELMETHFIPFEKAVDMVLNGEIFDAKTVSAILQAKVLRDK